MTTLTLIGKPGCHLCDDARAVVTTVLAQFPDAALTELSILDDDALRDRYAEEIPVLLIDGAVHTYWRVDPDRLRAALSTPAG
ncbi:MULTISPECIES: glutaredoxin family protein [unclassified Leifsonia]|uniref:glutaredoxin family protein n=1 Tax=unclassified Leifsonia TaxID=2663824 RepID=UPI0006FEC7EA|nr:MULTISPECIES: glutaredoxin family protein [unclassified Leifsonia]KQX05327.1 thioredoxin [Leifsonia sp. Root1293]KRA08959.1 thioredoxin [Leifsonia sp. Root60]